MAKEFTVTPWEVKGEIDYDKLIKQFGTEELTEDIINRIKKHTKELHYMLKRRIFFSHRDMRWLLDEYEKGNKFFLYTGRGPSGHTHLGHLMPWILTRWLQERFDVKLWFQMTDDEKFYTNKDLEIEETNRLAYENALDVIALGFNERKTFIFSDLDYAKTLYRQAARVAKKITFSTAKAAFGFTNETNLGLIFFTSMQSVPAFLESVKKGNNVPCLIPHAIDQDPHFRVCRDVMPKLGYYKPAAIHCRFLPGLGEGGKMSASEPETTIFTVDKPEDVRKKISKAFTGGRESVDEQRKLGGRPDICPIFQYWYHLEEDDKKVEEIRRKCLAGELLCGEDKQMITEMLNKFLKKHQDKREKARDRIEKFIVKD